MSNGTIVLFKIEPTSHADIYARLQELGPEYIRDYVTWHRQHGQVIVFGEVGLIADQPTFAEIVEGPPEPQFAKKTYRCEWVAEVFQVDQYDKRMSAREHPPFYEKAWPTWEQAIDDLEAVTIPHPHSLTRRRYLGASHDYYSCGVRYREVEEKS